MVAKGGRSPAVKVKKFKLKTMSKVKRRFKMTATGKILAAHSFKRHGMRKRSNKFIRNTRGMRLISDGLTKVVKKMCPNGLNA